MKHLGITTRQKDLFLITEFEKLSNYKYNDKQTYHS